MRKAGFFETRLCNDAECLWKKYPGVCNIAHAIFRGIMAGGNFYTPFLQKYSRVGKVNGHFPQNTTVPKRQHISFLAIGWSGNRGQPVVMDEKEGVIQANKALLQALLAKIREVMRDEKALYMFNNPEKLGDYKEQTLIGLIRHEYERKEEE